MSYEYFRFSINRSNDDARNIFQQRIEDATYIYNKYSDQMESRPCPVCNSTIYTECDPFHDQFKIAHCSKCTTVYVNPAPPTAALIDYYENCLCNRQLSKVIASRHQKSDPINDDRVKLAVEAVKNTSDKRKGTGSIKILEVGCNNGAFLSKLRTALLNHCPDVKCELFGIDIDPVAIANPVDANLSLSHASAEELSSHAPNEYDILLHFELIEHLFDPTSFVKALWEVLKPDGVMIFTTPNFAGLDNTALNYNNLRFLAHAIFPPMHLNAFSTSNIVHFLVSNGYHIEQIQTPGKLDMDILTQCKDELEEQLFKDLAGLPEQTKAMIQQLLIHLNASSHMQCIARKPK